VIFAGVNGFTDSIPVNQITTFEKQFISEFRAKHEDVLATIRSEQALSDDTNKKLKSILEDFVTAYT
jgi:F-type H+-transporting ATPase subunit alpha